MASFENDVLRDLANRFSDADESRDCGNCEHDEEGVLEDVNSRRDVGFKTLFFQRFVGTDGI